MINLKKEQENCGLDQIIIIIIYNVNLTLNGGYYNQTIAICYFTLKRHLNNVTHFSGHCCSSFTAQINHKLL